jgi:hypothetical protein
MSGPTGMDHRRHAEDASRQRRAANDSLLEQFTKEQDFSKVLQTSKDKNERLGIAVA